MCFSMTADVAAGAALVPVAAISLREVRHARELPFALLPAVFAVHQLVEAVVWAGQDGDVSSGLARAAALAYVLIAFPLLPTLVPTSVLMLEPRGARARVAPFVALGVVVSAYLTYAVLAHPLTVVTHDHGLEYRTGVENGTVWAVLYIVAVIGPAVLSGYPSIVAFGVLNLIGLTAVGLLYRQAFASLWCIYAAVASVFVVFHLVRRRRLPDPHRLGGAPLR